jgi:hypothetical protein
LFVEAVIARRLLRLIVSGVGHSGSFCRTASVSVPFAVRLSLSSLIGVGQSPRACLARLLPVAGRPAFVPLLLVASGVAFGVSQSSIRDDEDPLPTVRRFNIGRSYNRPLRVIPSIGQASENGIDSPNNESSDVLDNHDPRAKLANETIEFVPEPGSIPVQTNSLASVGDVLAREPADEDVDTACVFRPVERLPSGSRSPFASDAAGVSQIARSTVVTRSSPPLPGRFRLARSGPDDAFFASGVGQSNGMQDPDVSIAGNVGPMMPEDGSTEFVGLALPEDPESGSLKSEIESADPGEQRSDGVRVLDTRDHFPSSGSASPRATRHCHCAS